jgi:uncharacterized protein (TIGR02147 family)
MIFDFTDYRAFLRETLAKKPRKGRGQLLELAKFLRIHPTVVSQVLSGSRDFTEEQALEIAEFLSLTSHEENFLRLLVRHSRSSTAKLKSKLKREITEAQESARKLSARVNPEKILGESEKGIFYSNWLYSACRLYCSTHTKGRSLEEISAQFQISRVRAQKILQFLLQFGLCVEVEGLYQMGVQSTFVEHGSPHLSKHHSNWRYKAIQCMDREEADALMFTGPFSISKSDFEKLKEQLRDWIQTFSKIVKNSPAEEVACLNIDLFRVR